MTVSGYPAFIPSRDPHTWGRIMEHISVRLVSDAPEFLKALIGLNTKILAEAVQSGNISAETQGSRGKELDAAVEKALETRKTELVERLRQLHLDRNGGMVDNVEQKGSLSEGRGGEVPEEVGVWCLFSSLENTFFFPCWAKFSAGKRVEP